MLKNANYFAALAVIADRRRMTIAQPAPTISEPLTWEQICKRHPDQWVCLVEFDRIDPGRFAFRTARVVGHDPHRRTAVERSRPWWRGYEAQGTIKPHLYEHGIDLLTSIVAMLTKML